MSNKQNDIYYENLMDVKQNNLANIKFDIDLFGKQTARLSIKDRIGFVPISVWQPNWQTTQALKAEIGDTGQARVTLKSSTDSLMGAKVAVSIFNPHLAQMLLSAYCPQNAKVYNPFSGDWAMGFVASAMGHAYTGIEVRQEEVDAQLARQKVLGLNFDIICADSAVYDVAPNSFDFSYTCPPYYDLEVYSDNPADLSTASSYPQFLVGLQKVMANVYKALKPGALSVWVVGNFRDSKTGELRHFNGDVVNLGKQVGFSLWDEIIWWGASGVAAMRAGQFSANRKAVRVHEYIIIFKK